MTGIERLVDIVNDGPYSGGMIHISVQKLREICEQIEREVADISGYESDVLAFVEEKGGLEVIKERLRETIPEGCEWPRYESGELVGFGDEYVNARGNVSTLRTIVINDCRDRLGGGYYWKLGKGDCAVMVKNGERIKRPPVLAADGKPLEVGQTVWDTDAETDTPLTVVEVSSDLVRCDYAWKDGKTYRPCYPPDQLTHQRPVLDADGVPIDEGDTVWNATTGAGPFTVREIERSDDPDEPEDIVWCGEHAANGFKVWRIAGKLTHTKPEIDSWQRIEEDAGCTATKYNERRGTIFTTKQQVARDLVRRCRALAERERGE